MVQGKPRRLGARCRPGEGAWAWGGMRLRGGAFARTPRQPARRADAAPSGARRCGAVRRGALADYFKLDDFEHVYLPKIVLKCTKR
jgi:hypothetical protein